jgi:hypothetical protein
MSTASAAAGDPLSMKNVLDRVELLEKSYQEERLAVRSSPLFPFPLPLPAFREPLRTCPRTPRY